MNDQNRTRHMSLKAFAHLGADHTAYIRPVAVQNVVCYMLMSAMGQELTIAETYDAAAEAADEHGLTVVTLN